MTSVSLIVIATVLLSSMLMLVQAPPPCEEENPLTEKIMIRIFTLALDTCGVKQGAIAADMACSDAYVARMKAGETACNLVKRFPQFPIQAVRNFCRLLEEELGQWPLTLPEAHRALADAMDRYAAPEPGQERRSA